MAFFVVLVLILLMGVVGWKPNRAAYIVATLAAVGASAYEYLK